MNICLVHSSVGFYQVSKLFCVPISLLFEVIFGFKNQTLSYRLLGSIAIMLYGMYLVISEEIQYNSTGLFWAVVGTLTTSFTQVFFSTLKKDLGLDSMQLLFHTSPWLAFCSFLSIPLLEKAEELTEFKLTDALIYNLIFSSVIAAGYNITNYLVLSEMTPLTYNILGHFKTIVIIICGIRIFSMVPSTSMILGTLIAIIGVFLYSIETEKYPPVASISGGGGYKPTNSMSNSDSSSKQESFLNSEKLLQETSLSYKSASKHSHQQSPNKDRRLSESSGSASGHPYLMSDFDSIRNMDDRKWLSSSVLL